MTPSIKITVSERNGRDCASTGSAWETAIGYSRAIRAGDFISVTGTVGIEADGRFAPTMRGQTPGTGDHRRRDRGPGRQASDVVRTRIFVTDIQKWKEVGEVHGEFFDQVRPALTMVEISR